jgi:hypothetical protein
MCLINATATGIEILMSLILSYLCFFFPYSPPIGWTIFIPAPIGLLLQVALEHASVCLIIATATSTEILKSLILSGLCFSSYLPPIGWTIFYPAPIGQLLQVALEHASVCLINATATGTEILKSLVLPGLGSFTILDANKEYFTLFLSQTIYFYLFLQCLGPKSECSTVRLLESDLLPI